MALSALLDNYSSTAKAVPLLSQEKAFTAASWAYNVPSIRDFMKDNCDFFLETVEDLRKLLFD